MPPLLIGGGTTTLRRAAQYGDEWYPAFLSPAQLAADMRRLRELAGEHGRPPPGITINVMVGLGDLAPSVIDDQVGSPTVHGMTDAEARQAVITGNPPQASERFAELVEAGADRIVGVPFTGDRRRQSDLLAEAARLVEM
ncbi:MAG: hypothetical protein ACRDY6_20775 [Acidimicrobiia bacterium]